MSFRTKSVTGSAMKKNHRVKVGREEISAVHHEADSDRWIFFCHGFGSNKEGSYEERCNIMAENGWNAVRFDFRGNGESDGEFMEETLTKRIDDLQAVVDHFEPEKYVFFGSSFGGKVVFHAAAEDDNVKAILGKAPVTYNEIMDKFRSVVEKKGEFEYIDDKPIDIRFFEDLDEYSFKEAVKNLDVPISIFHGSKDTTVKPRHSYKALKELETDVSLHKIEDEKHSFTESGEEKMMDEMVSWLDNIEF